MFLRKSFNSRSASGVLFLLTLYNSSGDCEKPCAIIKKIANCANTYFMIQFYWFSTLMLNFSYDWRILGLGVLLGFNGNMVLMFDYFQFESKQVPVFRNLPFTFIKRISYQAIVVFIISIPEYFVMLKYFPPKESVLTLIYLMIYGSALSWMFLQIMMLREMPLDKIGKIGFFLILLQLILILANTPLLIMILIMGIFIGWVQLRYCRLISN